MKLSFSTSCSLGTALSLNLFPESRGPCKNFHTKRATFCSSENLLYSKVPLLRTEVYKVSTNLHLYAQQYREIKIKHSLVLLEVCEANKWQLVAHKGSGWRKGLNISFIILYVVEVTGVYVTVQLWHNWSHSWRTETERESWSKRGRGGGANHEGLRKERGDVLHKLRHSKDSDLVLQVFQFEVHFQETLKIHPGVNSMPTLVGGLK